MGELPLHIAVLDTLAHRVRARREAHKERMAKGLTEREYAIAVGQAREAQSLLELIDEMLQAARKDEIGDVEDVDEEGYDTQRSNRARRRAARS